MKKNNQIFGALSRTLCCVCAIVLCMCCLSSGTYGWYTETAKVTSTLEFGQWASAPVNLLSNGDFANGKGEWSNGNAGYTGNSIDYSEGFVKLIRGQEATRAPYVQQKITGTYPAGTYTLSGKVLVSGEEGCATAEIEISFKNGAGTVTNEPKKITFNGSGQPRPQAMTWTDFSVDVIVPAGETVTDLNVMLKHTLSKTGYICYDDISVVQKQP